MDAVQRSEGGSFEKEPCRNRFGEQEVPVEMPAARPGSHYLKIDFAMAACTPLV